MGRFRRVFARLIAACVVAAGLQVVTATPAQACVGSCGEATIYWSMLGGQTHTYGDPFLIVSGRVEDTSGVCCDPPSGEVWLYLNGAFFGSDVLYYDGSTPARSTQWGFHLGDLAPASYTARLEYHPGNFDSTSTSFSFAVRKPQTTVQLIQEENESIAGEPASFRAYVSGGYQDAPHRPAGSVDIFDGGTIVATYPVVDGLAPFDLALAGAYEHQLTARYFGNAYYADALDLARPIHHVVKKAFVTSLRVTFSPESPGLATQPIAMTTTVQPSTRRNVLTPTGSVRFVEENGPTLGTATLNSAGVATLTRTLARGDHHVVAVYEGDQSFEPRFDFPYSYTVNGASATVSIGQSPSSTVWSQPFDIVAPVSPDAPARGPVTGSVSFLDGRLEIGTRPLNFRVTPTLRVSNLDVGTHQLQARYGGDGNFGPANSGVLTHVVSMANVDVVADQSKETTVFGEQFTLRALVRAVAPALGRPTGTVTFTDTSTGDVLGTRSLDATGQASLPVTLAIGNHNISVVYSGDGHFNGGSGAVSHAVNKASSAVSVSSPTAEPSTLGDAVTLRAVVAAVAPGAGVPTGTVQFRDGSRLLGSPVALVNGAAQIVVPAFAGGRHDVSAIYSGDDHFLERFSPQLLRTVRCDQTVSGPYSSFNVTPNTTTCFANASVAGQLTIPAGARVSMVDSSFDRVFANQVAALVVCGSGINAGLTVTGASGPVSIGDPYLSACQPNQIGTARFASNLFGVRVLRNSFSQNLSVVGTSGGPTLIGGNTVVGTLACSNNNPFATNGGYPNTAGGRTGDCVTLDGTITPDPH